jgi:hypothetical protein
MRISHLHIGGEGFKIDFPELCAAKRMSDHQIRAQ